MEMSFRMVREQTQKQLEECRYIIYNEEWIVNNIPDSPNVRNVESAILTIKNCMCTLGSWKVHKMNYNRAGLFDYMSFELHPDKLEKNIKKVLSIYEKFPELKNDDSFKNNLETMFMEELTMQSDCSHSTIFKGCTELYSGVFHK